MNHISDRVNIFTFAGDNICLEPDPSPENGELIFSKSVNGTILAGALAQYKCSDGYQVLGPDKKICMESGDWEPKDKVFCILQQ